MSVTTELMYAEMNWTGVEGSFSPGFPADQAAEVLVRYRPNSTGIEANLTVGVEYTIALAPTTNLITITPVALPAAPGKVIIERDTVATVEAAFVEGNGVAMKTHQRLHDRAAMRDAELGFNLARAIKVPKGEAEMVLLPAATRANKLFGFDNLGNPAASAVATNSVLSGVGAPAAGLGANGDFYVNTATNEFYGPKTAGAWGAPVGIISLNVPGLTEITAGIDGAADFLLLYDTSAALHKKLKPNNFPFSLIPASTITTPMLAANAVDNTKLADGAVATAAKIVDGIITFVKMAAAALATSANYLAATASKLLTADQVWAAGAATALTDGATITPDFSAGINFTVTLGGNRTLANPTNVKAGQAGCIVINQDGTGSRTLAYGSNWKFAGGPAPTLTTTASKKDLLYYYAETSSILHASLAKLSGG